MVDLNRCFLIVIFIYLAKNVNSTDPKFQACAPRSCGSGPNISYPFYIIPDQESYCGFPGFQINCTNKHPILALSGVDYLIKDLFYNNHSIRLANAAVYDNVSCPAPLHNISLDRTPFSFSPDHTDFFFLYNCTKTPTAYFTYPLSCASNSTRYSFAGFHEEALESSNFSATSCSSVVNVPVDVGSDELEGLFGMSYTDVLEIGFLLNWTAQNCNSCESSGGRCGFDNKEFVCFCRDKPHSKTCPASLLAYDYRYTNCSQPFSCGGISDVTYPFWGGDRADYCGLSGLELTCEEDNIPRILMEKKTKYRIIEFSSNTRTLTVVRDDYYETVCPTFFSNSSIDFSNFNYASDLRNITIFYKCSDALVLVSGQATHTCNVNATTFNAYSAINDSEVEQLIRASCSSNVKVTVFDSSAEDVIAGKKVDVDAINGGFGLQWKSSTNCINCMQSGGSCGFNSSLNGFACFCYDQPSNTSVCSYSLPGKKKSWKLWLGIGAVTSTAAILLILATYCLIRRKNHMPLSPWKKTQADLKVEAFLREYGSLAPKRYTYSEIKKMTDSFKEKLGQGGFGAVYKGKSPNGCLVAVKLLNISKGNGEDFINEVASISRTSHVNVVTLLGFCLQGRKRALVYEFMPNGSLEKFIFNKKTTVQASHQLGWEKLYHILVGIARGLEYLHRGCNTRILHFDIKPHNILLDDDFSPKISDFGLAKLCSAKDSKISMLEARGTIGYIAPEVFSRNFGPVSHKSDVFSYGMMVLEMVGGRKNLDVGVSDLSEMYFPHWIYKRLELGAEFQGLQGVTTGKETEIVKKMILVGLWCIQTNPSDRPAISKVIEMLEGNVEALEIPPRPFLSSPPRSPPTQSMSDSTSISTSKILEIS